MYSDLPCQVLHDGSPRGGYFNTLLFCMVYVVCCMCFCIPPILPISNDHRSEELDFTGAPLSVAVPLLCKVFSVKIRFPGHMKQIYLYIFICPHEANPGRSSIPSVARSDGASCRHPVGCCCSVHSPHTVSVSTTVLCCGFVECARCCLMAVVVSLCFPNIAKLSNQFPETIWR